MTTDGDVDPEEGYSPWSHIPARPSAIVDVTFGPDLLLAFLREPGGVAVWNHWVRGMFEAGLINPSGGDDDPDPLLMAGIDFTAADMRGLRLDGVDLSHAWLGGTDFTGSSLRGAMIGCCPRALFRHADLCGAVMEWGEITGTDFTDARMEGFDIRDSSYGKGSPPTGLPGALLSLCREDPPDPPEDDDRIPPGRPIRVGGRLLVMMSRGRR